jgi:hypothetical protein
LVLISTLELQVEFHDGRRQFSRWLSKLV